MNQLEDHQERRPSIPLRHPTWEERDSLISRWGHAALATCLIVLMSLCACTYRRAYLSYPHHPGEVPLHATSLDGERLGVIRAREGGPVWKDCTDVAEGSIWVLVEQTKRLGGNAIGEVRFFPSRPHLNPEEAVCRQRWGWLLVWPVLLTPAFQLADVEATAYRVPPDTISSKLYVIPDSPVERAEMVARIARQMVPIGD
jgi:hypothetical protein